MPARQHIFDHGGWQSSPYNTFIKKQTPKKNFDNWTLGGNCSMPKKTDFENRTELFTKIRNPDFKAPKPIKKDITNPQFYLGETKFQYCHNTSSSCSQLISEKLSHPFGKPDSNALPFSTPQVMTLPLNSNEENDSNQFCSMDLDNEKKNEPQKSNFTRKRLSSTEYNHEMNKLICPYRSPTKKEFEQDFPDFSHMKEILDAFAFTTGKLNPNSNFAQNLIQHHLRARHLDKTTLISQLSLLASVIAEFASTQFVFASLKKEDQKILLQNNVPLYLQYILARYLGSGSGLEQISWILEGQVSLQNIEELTNLNLITLNELNSAVGLYSSPALVDLYQYLSDNIR